MKKIFTAILLFSASILYSQPLFNYDFETISNNQPVGWYMGGEHYEAVVDSNVHYSGSNSIRLTQLENKEKNFGVITGTFPLKFALGKKIKFTGWIKTEKVKDGYAGLWLRVDGPEMKTLAFDNMHDRGVKGTTDWKKYEIELTCHTSAININYGALHTGNGTAWFDKFEITLDGVPFTDESAKIPEPNESIIEWVKNNSIKLNTVNSNSGFDDLMPLKELFKDAKIIGLGEATHGTSEIFKMKHRMVEFLAGELGYTIFAIEANMPESYAVNEYILNGNGDVKELLSGMYFWTWQTQEVADMIEWMRQFNASGKGKILFTGFDMQFTGVAAEKVKYFFDKYDPGFAEDYNIIKEELRSLNDYNYAQNRTENDKKYADSITAIVIERFEKKSGDYLKTISADTVNRAKQNAVVLRQGSLHNGKRDKYMADNVEWIYKNSPEGTKMVLWAHNYHISRMQGAMGFYLAEKFGSAYVPVGFCIGSGTYTAVSKPGSEYKWIHELEKPFAGTIEYAFTKTLDEISYLDLKNFPPNVKYVYIRSIGSMEVNNQFREEPVKAFYDGLIYINKTTHTDMFLIQK